MGNWEFLCVCEHPKIRLATRDWTTDRHLNKGTVPVLYCLIGIDIEFQKVIVVRQSVLMPMGLNSMDFITHILFIIPSFVNCLCH